MTILLCDRQKVHDSSRGDGWTSSPALSNARSMDKTQFSVREILAGAAPKDVPVTVKGWVRTRRDSKAGISFVHLSDGSAFHPLQVVAPNTLPNYTDEVLKLSGVARSRRRGRSCHRRRRGSRSRCRRVPSK